jgi:hypothetical protein
MAISPSDLVTRRGGFRRGTSGPHPAFSFDAEPIPRSGETTRAAKLAEDLDSTTTTPPEYIAPTLLKFRNSFGVNFFSTLRLSHESHSNRNYGVNTIR